LQARAVVETGEGWTTAIKAGNTSPPSYEATLPSDFVVLSDYVESTCESGWFEIDNLLLQVYEGSPTGTFRVELGSCDGACQVNGQGVYVHSKVDATAEIELS